MAHCAWCVYEPCRAPLRWWQPPAYWQALHCASRQGTRSQGDAFPDCCPACLPRPAVSAPVRALQGPAALPQGIFGRGWGWIGVLRGALGLERGEELVQALRTSCRRVWGVLLAAGGCAWKGRGRERHAQPTTHMRWPFHPQRLCKIAPTDFHGSYAFACSCALLLPFPPSLPLALSSSVIVSHVHPTRPSSSWPASSLLRLPSSPCLSVSLCVYSPSLSVCPRVCGVGTQVGLIAARRTGRLTGGKATAAIAEKAKEKK